MFVIESNSIRFDYSAGKVSYFDFLDPIIEGR